MTDGAVVEMVVVTMTVGIPLAGLTLRYSLKPLVDAYLRVREVHAAPEPRQLQVMEARLQALERLLLVDATEVAVPERPSVRNVSLERT